jgi:hypothetical protein
VAQGRASDAAVSDCARGTALLRKGLPYSVWAEWTVEKRVVRSRMKAIPPTLTGYEPIELPLQPFE